jgi:hypothetical protein
MSTTCRSCGFTIEADDLFCGNCGETVTTGQAAPAETQLPLADAARTAGPPTPDTGPTWAQSRPRHAGGEAFQVQEQPQYAAPPGPGAGYAGQGQGPLGLPPPSQVRAASKGFLASLFDFGFTSYVTPTVVKVLYVLVMVWLALSSFVLVVVAFFALGPVVGILTLIIVAPLYFLWFLALNRISLEFFVVIFRIAEDMRALRLRGEIR